jgi:hypothetical protein
MTQGQINDYSINVANLTDLQRRQRKVDTKGFVAEQLGKDRNKFHLVTRKVVNGVMYAQLREVE